MKFYYSYLYSFATVQILILYQTHGGVTENINDPISLKHCCSENVKCETEDNWIDLDFISKSISYRWEKSSASCTGLAKMVELDVSQAKFNKSDERWTIPNLDRQSNAVILKNGTVELLRSGQPYDLYTENNYCIKKASRTTVQMGICCSEKYPCVRKCCAPGEHVTINGGDVSCMLDKADENIYLATSQNKKSSTNYITGFSIICDNPIFQKIKWPEGDILKQSVGKNGELFRYFDTDVKEWKNLSDTSDYCMDMVEEKKECRGIVPTETGIMWKCVPKKPESLEASTSIKFENMTKPLTKNSQSGLYSIFYTACFIIAMLFLLATAVVKFLLWEKQNIHSWTILSYVSSLFLLYLCLIILYLEKNSSSHFKLGFCVFMGVMTHFFAFCAFCWLSVINFDLWWTFRVLTPVTESKLEFQRFMWYAAFAVLLPVLMISVSLGLHFSYKEPSIVVKCGYNFTVPHPSTLNIEYPKYGVDSCFLSYSALLPYLYGPLGFLLLTNLIFYLTTTLRMFTLYKTSRRASETSSKKQRQSCRLFLKLFVVAGLTWSFEFVYWACAGTSSKWYWALLDMANIFQAIAIFVIFVCKKETVRSLEQKYPSLKGNVLVCRTAIFGPIARFTRSPTFQERSTDGSTKISRTELSKNGVSDSIQKQESIELS